MVVVLEDRVCTNTSISKSQIALEYAFRLHESELQTSIFWIDASDSTHLEQDYLRILVQAEVVNIESSVSPSCEDVKRWLASHEAGSWLIIVDGADNKDLFSGSRSLSELVPRNPRGSVIFTTRNKQLGLFLAPATDVVLLSGLNPPDARHLLAITSGQSITEEVHINQLLSSLEYLPLAICQAGSFMALNSISSLEYLHFFNRSESSKIQLLSEDFEDHGRTGVTNTRPVVLTWKASFEQIKKNNNLAAQLLSLIAFLDHQRVHKALLAPIASEIELVKALGLLQSYSLIKMDAKHDFIDIHRLVHLATRNWLESEDMFMESIKSCFDAIRRYQSSVCSPYDDMDACINFQARNGTQPSDESSFMKDEARALLALQVSQYLQTLGYYDSAAINANTAVRLGKKASGERSQSTLAKLSNLGIVYRYQGKHHDAREVTEHVLDARMQTLGPGDPRTLASMNNMAWILNAMGEYGKAEEIYRETVKLQEKVLGTENTDILITLSNLAVSLQSSGRYQAAEEIYRRVLESRALNLGTDHPETLSSISDLGAVYYLQGNLEGAEKWHDKALKGREKILGQKHHKTLDSMSHLGCVFHSQHRFEAAEDLFRKVLGGYSTRYGTEHSTTLLTMSNLAIILQCREKYQEAEELVRKVLISRENTLGERHRDTLFSANHLEGLLGIRECLEDRVAEGLESLNMQKFDENKGLPSKGSLPVMAPMP
jgi:tetratricopeptide (TPR) repeat protein